ncbi:MAG TPA: protoheme IX farnesyltransferase [Bacteroidales bacterium]|nr:protoheme IX farnesyltransferase [Bacteroidales bacterium]
MIISLSLYARLSKLKIMIPVSLTGFAGYFVFKPVFSAGIWLVTAGILLLGISASVLNQLQEIEIDKKMDRTRNRPLASGLVSKRKAYIFSALSLLAGAALILLGGNTVAFLTGLFTLFWYNVVYTYSKRLTSFAVFPGALTGALPPMIGWIAAGGAVFDTKIILIGLLFFIGQMPHFWLILLKYGREYQEAGLPCLTGILTRQQIERLIFVWVALTGIAAILLYISGIIGNEVVALVILASTLILIWQTSSLVSSATAKPAVNRYQALLNAYFLLLIFMLVSDRIITVYLS